MLRNGMWVVDENGRVGILIRDASGMRPSEFHAVNTAGETAGVEPADPLSLRQATYDEIPKARRPAPDVAAKYGYARGKRQRG